MGLADVLVARGVTDDGALKGVANGLLERPATLGVPPIPTRRPGPDGVRIWIGWADLAETGVASIRFANVFVVVRKGVREGVAKEVEATGRVS